MLEERRKLLKATGGIIAMWTLPIGTAMANSSIYRCVNNSKNNPQDIPMQTVTRLETINDASGRLMNNMSHANGRPFQSYEITEEIPLYTFEGTPVTESCWNSISAHLNIK